MIILDTNVVSELMEDPPAASVATWIDQQPSVSIWTTSITMFEVEFGLACLPTGSSKRDKLTDLFRLFLNRIDHRVVPFDTAAANHAATISSMRKVKGRPVDLRDTMIAGIVLARRATLVTRNTRHFADLNIAVVNPWTA